MSLKRNRELRCEIENLVTKDSKSMSYQEWIDLIPKVSFDGFREESSKNFQDRLKELINYSVA